MRKINAVLIALCAVSVHGIALAQSMTVEEYEQRQLRIMQSDLSYEEKLKQLNQMASLVEANNKLQGLLHPNQTPEAQQRERDIERHVKQSESTNSESQKMLEGIKRQLRNELFLTELVVIGDPQSGTVGSATIITNNRTYPVDLDRAISEKTRFGEYTITGYDQNSVIFQHHSTKQKVKRAVQDAESVANQVKFNRDLLNKYTEKALIGNLDVEIKNQAAPLIPTPQPVMY